MSSVNVVLEKFIETYPIVKGATLESLKWPVQETVGSHIEEIKAYKDVIISSVDEGFQPQFSFIMLDKGSVVVFFFDENNFLCIYTDETLPNKELALRMFNDFQAEFLTSLQSSFK